MQLCSCVQVFSVQLNYEHTIVDRLDIFAAAGFGIGHDEIVPFSVRKGELHVNKESSSFDGTLHVEFVKVVYCFGKRLSLLVIGLADVVNMHMC